MCARVRVRACARVRLHSSPVQSTRHSAGLRGADLPHSWNQQSALVSAGPTVEQTLQQHGLNGSGQSKQIHVDVALRSPPPPCCSGSAAHVT